MQVLENFTFLKWMMNYIISPGVDSHRRTLHKEIRQRHKRSLFPAQKSACTIRYGEVPPHAQMRGCEPRPLFSSWKCSPIRRGHKVNLMH